MNSQLLEICESIWTQAEEVMLDRGRVPMMYFLIKDNKVAWFPVPAVEKNKFDQAKRIVSQVVTETARKFQVSMVVVISETWVVAVDKDKRSDIMPSEHPDRVEQVMMMCKSSSGKIEVKVGNIIRNKDQVAIYNAHWQLDLENNETTLIGNWAQ